MLVTHFVFSLNCLIAFSPFRTYKGDGHLHIRQLNLEDAASLAAFYNNLSAASKRTFRPIDVTTTAEVCASIAACNRTAPPTKYDLVAVHEGSIIGWSFLWDLNKGDPEKEPVFGLAIADAYHGQGLGTALMTRVMAWAEARGLASVILTVVTDNLVAQHLYEKQGFVRYGEPFMGEDGLRYYRMRKDFEQA
jgi:RimJ/RimL family protein N-acetyltransferase